LVQNRTVVFHLQEKKTKQKGGDDKETMKIILDVITSQERKVRKLTKNDIFFFSKYIIFEKMNKDDEQCLLLMFSCVWRWNRDGMSHALE